MIKEKTFVNTHEINRIANELDNLYHHAALKLNLSDSAMFVLYTIYENGGKCPLNKICSSGICKQTINSALRKLEDEEILYLEQYNGKSKLVLFTEKGIQCARQTIARLFDAEENVYCDWEQEEIDMYIKLNRKYLEKFKEQIEKM